jgi:nucleotide-binding universal stress UspA family protein
VDGSENSLRAAMVAISIAKTYNASLLILNVIAPILSVSPTIGAGSFPNDYQSYYNDAEQNGSGIVDRIAKLAESFNLQVHTFVERSHNSVADTIVQRASDEKADLIVIGTRGLGGFRRLILGSVSSGALSHAHCNVLIVR